MEGSSSRMFGTFVRMRWLCRVLRLESIETKDESGLEDSTRNKDDSDLEVYDYCVTSAKLSLLMEL